MEYEQETMHKLSNGIILNDFEWPLKVTSVLLLLCVCSLRAIC